MSFTRWLRNLNLAFVVTIGLALIVFQGPRDDRERAGPRPPDYSWPEMIGIFQKEQELLEEVERVHLFRETLTQTRQEVLAGSLQLEEAALRVEKEAQANNPAFFQAIAFRFEGKPIREKLALILLSDLELEAEDGMLNPEEKARVVELRQEYECRSNAR